MYRVNESQKKKKKSFTGNLVDKNEKEIREENVNVSLHGCDASVSETVHKIIGLCFPFAIHSWIIVFYFHFQCDFE